jgi:hypothetical protein
LTGKKEKDASTGTSTLIEKTRRACKNQDVGPKPQGAFIVVKDNGSEKTTNVAVGIGGHLTQKVVRPRKIEILLRKEKYRTIFATLEDNVLFYKMLTHARTMKSDTFLRFTVAARADILLTSANIQEYYDQPKTNCQKPNRDIQSILVHILNGCLGNMTEMTRRHNKVVDIVRIAIDENMREITIEDW